MTALERWLTIGIVFTSLVGGPVRADDKKERDSLQGTWIFTKHEVNGNNGGGTEDSKLNLTVQADRYAVRLDESVVQQGTLKLDVSKTPWTIDVQVAAGQDEGKTLHGIYEVTGDTFRACFDTTGKSRPTEFNTSEGSGRILVEGKRKK